MAKRYEDEEEFEFEEEKKHYKAIYRRAIPGRKCGGKK
jgi:hypothetical protein